MITTLLWPRVQVARRCSVLSCCGCPTPAAIPAKSFTNTCLASPPTYSPDYVASVCNEAGMRRDALRGQVPRTWMVGGAALGFGCWCYACSYKAFGASSVALLKEHWTSFAIMGRPASCGFRCTCAARVLLVCCTCAACAARARAAHPAHTPPPRLLRAPQIGGPRPVTDSWEHMWWDNLHWKRWKIPRTGPAFPQDMYWQ